MTLLGWYVVVSIITAIITKIDLILREKNDLLFMTHILAGLLWPFTLPLFLLSMLSRFFIYLITNNND